MGFSAEIARKTLADANEKRDWRIYRDLAQIFIEEARRLYVNDKEFSFEIENTIYALDSTTIDLCLNVFKWAKFRKKKGAVKMHTLLDLRGEIPTFIEITDGKVHDVKILSLIEFEAGAFYIMDKAYTDFEKLYEIQESSAFFIIRAKKNICFKRMYSNKVDKDSGIRCDQIIRFTGPKTSKLYPDKLRRIKYYYAEKKKYYVFLTNNFTIDAKLVADLYRYRWKIEIFFKWIKQHLRIKIFWGESKNAVKTQLWIAVCVYVLVAIIKKKLKIKQSLYEILQILSVSPFDKNPLDKLFSENYLQNFDCAPPEQAKLLEI
jgi:transposase